jgi:hypothetical protein
MWMLLVWVAPHLLRANAVVRGRSGWPDALFYIERCWCGTVGGGAVSFTNAVGRDGETDDAPGDMGEGHIPHPTPARGPQAVG